jgi:hypothetical protein
MDLGGLLERIGAEMPAAPEVVQWTMNTPLAASSISHVPLPARAMGIYRDYPTPKGCTSLFAPLWIGEMVRRAG